MAERQNAFGYEELLAHGRGELPGQMDARLPAPPMLMFNRITRIDETGGAYGKGCVTAELDVNPDLWFFKCHFIGDPVMPGCLGLDAAKRPTAAGLADDVKLVEYGIDIKRVMRSRLTLGIADGWVKADGKLIYEAKDLRVGLFTDAQLKDQKAA